MIVNLDKRDLFNLVKGIEPPYFMVNELFKKNLGKMWGGHKEEWEWNKYNLEELTEEELYTVYQSVRNAKENTQEIVSYENFNPEESMQEISVDMQKFLVEWGEKREKIFEEIINDHDVFKKMLNDVEKRS